MVAKLLWASLRTRPDILLALSFLTSRVQHPDEDDWKKLIRLLTYVKCTSQLKLRLCAEQTNIIKWWVDASFGTRDDYKSQTGAYMSLGKGSMFSWSKKQKLNTTSSTEAELVGVHDLMPQIIWTRYFLNGQGCNVTDNVVFQDNQSAMLLEKNGMKSSSKRTRHINLRYFFVKDRASGESPEIDIQYCPTDSMIGDFMTKPLQGQKFLEMRAVIMNEIEVE